MASTWATIHVVEVVKNGNFEAPGGGVDHPPPYTLDQYCHPGTPTIYSGVPFWCHTGDGGVGDSGGSRVVFGRAGSSILTLVEQQTAQPLVSGWTYELRAEMWGSLPAAETRLQLYDGATPLGSPVTYTGDVLHTLRTFTYTASANGTSSGVTIRLTGLTNAYTMFDNVFLKRWRTPTSSSSPVISPAELYIGAADTHLFTGGITYESDPTTPLNGATLSSSSGLFQTPATVTTPFDVRVRAVNNSLTSDWATIHVAQIVKNGNFEAPGGGVDHPPPYTLDQYCHPGTPTIYSGVPFWCHTGDGGVGDSGGSRVVFGRAGSSILTLVEQQTAQPLVSGWTYELRAEMWGSLPAAETRLQLYDGATPLGSPVTYTGDVLHTLRTFTYTASANGTSSGVTIRLTGLTNAYTMFDNVSLKRWRLPSGGTPPPPPVTITFNSNPAGRTLTIDGASCTAGTNCVFPWTPGSTHTVIALPQSAGTGAQYALSSWTPNVNTSFTTPTAPATYTANFALQYWLTTIASPPTGGSVTVTPATGGWYNAQSQVNVNATSFPGYQFVNFSNALNGSANPQPLNMTGPLSVTANFAPILTRTLTSAPPGLQLTVDGSPCTAPCSFQRTEGSTPTIGVASSTQTGSPTGTQYVFSNWSDLGGPSHQITVSTSVTTYTANFTTRYFLTTSYTPQQPAGGIITPTSQWYDSGTVVPVSATPNTGFVFGGFSGSLSEGSSTQNVTMNIPRNVTANFYVQYPTITSSSPLTPATVGVPYSYSLSASGGMPPYFWSLISCFGPPGSPGCFPPGFGFGPGNTVQGMPQASGTYAGIYLQVTDVRQHSVSAPFDITIGAGTNISVSCSSTSNPVVGQPLTFSAVASGGSGAPYTYTWSGDVSGTGSPITITPTQIRPYTTTVTARDSLNNTSSRSCTADVQSGGTSLTITTPNPLPSGIVGASYSPVDLTAIGGTTPYTWSVVSGSLLGLTLASNGHLSGTPQSPGASTVTIRVSDIGGRTATATFNLTVPAGPPSQPVTASPPSTTVAPGGLAEYTVTVNSSAGLSGAVTLSAAGLPAGSTATFTPATLSYGSGIAALTVSTATSSPLGTFAVLVVAHDGSRSYNTVVMLKLSATSPANMLSPASGAILGGSTATFVWDSGVGASQYQLSLGATPGASNYYFATTGSTQFVTANIPSSSQPLTIYATLGSLISGTWQNRSYDYRVGVSSSEQPLAAQATSSPAYVLNDGIPKI